MGFCSSNNKFTGPWDIKDLQKTPKHTVTEHYMSRYTLDGVPDNYVNVKDGIVLNSIFYDGVPFKGKSTRVFAYYAYPKNAKGKLPGMVLLHGGGGTAYGEWACLWAERGYAAIAMDLQGVGQDLQRLPDGSPPLDNPLYTYDQDEVGEFWSYHSVANSIKAISLLGSMPQVDPDRIGVTGISWGGYLTCIVAGLDNRLKVAVPVYGCGYLYEDTVWNSIFSAMPEKRRNIWIENFDPSRYLKNVKIPMLFVNGTNDVAYYLGSYQKSYRLVKNRTIRVTTDPMHSMRHGWSFEEVGLFTDQYLRNGKALPKIEKFSRNGCNVELKVKSALPIIKVQLNYTTDTGSWRERKWQSVDVKFDNPKLIKTELPDTRPIVYLFTVTDNRNATVSSEYESLEK